MIIRPMLISVILAFSPAAVSYAKAPVVSTKEEGKLVRPHLYAFVDMNLKAFRNLVAEDFVPDKTGFLRQVSEALYKGKPLNLEFISGAVSNADGKSIVSFKWRKSVLDGASRQMENKEGSAEFVFVNEKNIWLLFQINGDNPFTL